MRKMRPTGIPRSMQACQLVTGESLHSFLLASMKDARDEDDVGLDNH